MICYGFVLENGVKTLQMLIVVSKLVLNLQRFIYAPRCILTLFAGEYNIVRNGFVSKNTK